MLLRCEPARSAARSRSGTSCSEVADAATWRCLAARRLGLPDRRLRALGGLEAALAARRGRRDARGASSRAALWQAGARRAAARRRAPAPTRRALAELDALADAFLANPVANRASRAQGARVPRHRARVWPDRRRRALAARGGGAVPCTSRRVSGVVFRALGRAARRDAAALLSLEHGARRALGRRPPRPRRHATRRSGCSASCGRRSTRSLGALRDAPRSTTLAQTGAAARSAAGARTTGCTRGCFSPEGVPDGHTTTARPHPPRTTTARPGTSTHRERPHAPRDYRASAPSPSASAARSAAARPRCCSRSAGGCATGYSLGVVTNDIFTREDAEFLVRNQALPAERIRAVETGGCPHAAIREDISHNLVALEQLMRRFAAPSCCSSRAAATTSPRSSAASWPTTRSTSSTSPAATRSRARAARASRSPTCWSSTRPTSPRSSAPTSA